MTHDDLIYYVKARLAESRDRSKPCWIGRRLSLQEQREVRALLRMERFRELAKFIQEIDGV